VEARHDKRWTWIILLLAGLCEGANAGDMPQDQRQFIDIVEHFDRAYAQADNEITKSATRLQRAKAICVAIRTPVVRNWTGTVFKISSNREGKGVLELTLSAHMRLTTWNDSVADIGDNTLINPNSPLFGYFSKRISKCFSPEVFSLTLLTVLGKSA
jgi:hypothetical protein